MQFLNWSVYWSYIWDFLVMLNFSTRFRFAIQGQKSFNNVKLQSKPESSLQKSMKLITLLRGIVLFFSARRVWSIVQFVLPPENYILETTWTPTILTPQVNTKPIQPSPVHTSCFRFCHQLGKCLRMPLKDIARVRMHCFCVHFPLLHHAWMRCIYFIVHSTGCWE